MTQRNDSILSDEDHRAAIERGEERARREPRAEHVSYDSAQARVTIGLRGGAVVALPVAFIDELAGATPKQLAAARVSFAGECVTWDDLDADISVPGLLRELAGIDASAAASLIGRKGGSAVSSAKTTAVRRNGAKGGRPRAKPNG